MFVRRVGLEGVQRLRGRDAEPAPLAGREAPEPVVTADATAGFVDEAPGRRREPVPAEERPVVVAAEEARLLALGAARGGEPGGGGLGAGLLLGLLSEREPEPAE